MPLPYDMEASPTGIGRVYIFNTFALDIAMSSFGKWNMDGSDTVTTTS